MNTSISLVNNGIFRHDISSGEALAMKIFRHIQTSIYMKFRYLEHVMFRLKLYADTTQDIYGSDGEQLIYNPLSLIRGYQDEPHRETRRLMHSVFHCLYLHPFTSPKCNVELWNLACDIVVEATLIYQFSEFSLDDDDERKVYIDEIKRSVKLMTLPEVYFFLQTHDLKLKNMKDLFTFDEHVWLYPKKYLSLSGQNNQDTVKLQNCCKGDENNDQELEIDRAHIDHDPQNECEHDDQNDQKNQEQSQCQSGQASQSQQSGQNQTSQASQSQQPSQNQTSQGSQNQQSSQNQSGQGADKGQGTNAGAESQNGQASQQTHGGQYEMGSGGDRTSQADGASSKWGAEQCNLGEHHGQIRPDGVPGLSKDQLRDEWKNAAQKVEVDKQHFQGQGSESGLMEQCIENAVRDSIDYSDFLKQFAVMEECLMINQDEFDQVFYSYGLTLPGAKKLLIEPLEYKDDKRVREFVIAIDTSGSCSGSVVRNFINKTFSILKTTETFSDRVRIHIIQCDATIQEHKELNSLEDVEKYMKKFKVKGLGGTDFRPVFEYIDKRQKKGHFLNLTGLVYFTDGYGTYPRTPTKYKTAFAFLDNYSDQDVPAWAYKVYINEIDGLIE